MIRITLTILVLTVLSGCGTVRHIEALNEHESTRKIRVMDEEISRSLCILQRNCKHSNSGTFNRKMGTLRNMRDIPQFPDIIVDLKNLVN